MNEIDINEYLARRKESDILVDVRESFLYKMGNIAGSINIPMSECGRLFSLDKGDIYVYCHKGDISGEAVKLLCDIGYNACNLKGGYLEYLRNKSENKE